MHFKAGPSGPPGDGALEARSEPGHEVFVARCRGEICKVAVQVTEGGNKLERVGIKCYLWDIIMLQLGW